MKANTGSTTHRGHSMVDVKNGKVRVRMVEQKKVAPGKYEEEKHEFILEAEDCPEEVRPGKWWVSVWDKKMNSICPVDGVFEVKFAGLTAKKDEAPKPKSEFYTFTPKGSDKQVRVDFQTFTAILEIVEGEAKGMKLLWKLRYNFAPDKSNPKLAAFKDKSKYSKELADFMEAVGFNVEETDIPYKDNLLPPLEKHAFRFANEGKTFRVREEKGFVQSVMDGEPNFEDFEPEVEE